MLSFITTLQKFASQGDKTGWTIIGVAAEQANKPQSNTKNSFRVKGKLDEYAFEGATFIPTGESDFIKAINATMRQPIKKRNDDTVKVILEFDENGYQLNADFIDCLNDEPTAISFFSSLTSGHKNYFSKWIESAKTIETKSKCIP